MVQTTLAKPIHCSGVGLHSGRKVRLALEPAAEHSGIRFRLGGRVLPLSPEAVASTTMATTLALGQERISTVEHLLATLHGLGVDNALVTVEGGEAPVLDGSAAGFVELVLSAGIRKQRAPRKVAALARPVELVREDKWIRGAPYQGLRVDFTIAFDHPLIGRQSLRLDITPETFANQVAPARTFGFARQLTMLRQNGLALGGSLDNAVLLDDHGVVNSDGLRFADEFVRHKMLDFIGDMAVLGMPLRGDFSVFASGHALNVAFVRHMLAQGVLDTQELREPAAVSVPGRVRPAQPAVAQL